MEPAWNRWKRCIFPYMILELVYYALLIPLTLALRSNIASFFASTLTMQPALQQSSQLTQEQLAPIVQALDAATNNVVIFALVIAPLSFIILHTFVKGMEWALLAGSSPHLRFVKRFTLPNVLMLLILGGIALALLPQISLESVFIFAAALLILSILYIGIILCMQSSSWKKNMMSVLRITGQQNNIKLIFLFVVNEVITLASIILFFLIVLTADVEARVVASGLMLVIYSLICVAAHCFCKAWIVEEMYLRMKK